METFLHLDEITESGEPLEQHAFGLMQHSPYGGLRRQLGQGCLSQVESFILWKMSDVIKSLAADNTDWKPNVAVVIIDMLLRPTPSSAAEGNCCEAQLYLVKPWPLQG